ncbi:hypothetical protein [Streptomyces scopuliridis]|uniref:hypothetical protein n=1 Tax=Streptomyces scopuliridis TaxID=452529 RepID=UPI00342838D9
MKNQIEALMRLMPPHSGAGSVVDWPRVEQAWGTCFPDDYKQFVAVYGAGAIDGYLGVMTPEVSDDGRPAGAMEEETEIAREDWGEDGAPRPEGISLGPERVMAWGVDATADLLCWLASGDDPDAWPVVVYSRGKDRWILHQCGMVEFLCKIFHAEFDEHPLSGAELWGNASPRFLTKSEEESIRASGREPWSDAIV